MRISYSKNSQKELREIKNYISKFNPEDAKRFIKKLKNNIENIPNFPYKYRKSIYFDDENIRDMIIDGYTIIYEIKNDKIIILNIFNKNKGEK